MGEKLVMDLETQREFSQVEGRKPELLGISIAGVYSYNEDRYDAYMEAQLDQLAPRVQQAELLIGFNIRRFDLPVLQPYLSFSIANLPVLDIMDDVVKALGHRVSLESLGKATLGRGKSGHGLEALEWFRQGRFDLITQYCLDDVRLTKDVYDYGRQQGRLLATNRFGAETLQIPVFWPDRKQDLGTMTKMLHEAFEKRLQVEIEYQAQAQDGEDTTPSQRRVDVYYIREPYLEGYCHTRQDIRQFRIERILDLKPTWNRYAIPSDYIPMAMAE